ncbi:MAG: 3-oxoacyl-ACP reductase [Streptococcaceae bacterium]|jgi:3-oxoacyl-[acyl-carrier protein] reductase|nr:3-oxoacyl-ACP reductase [Streptococcaceae bacterium]
MRFDGKTVLVTGAGSGIGKAQAAAFREKGARVIGADLHGADVCCDVSDEKAVQKLSLTYEKIDVLCNTAGILDGYTKISETDLSQFETIMRNNVTSQFLMAKYFLPSLRQTKGVLINMASIAGLQAGGGGVAYTTSKHAVIGLTKQVALDEAPNVRVLAIAPGAINTPMNQADFTENNGKMAREVAEKTPAKRWASAEEVAQLTLFLASPAADYMTGSIIPIDGGWMLGK